MKQTRGTTVSVAGADPLVYFSPLRFRTRATQAPEAHGSIQQQSRRSRIDSGVMCMSVSCWNCGQDLDDIPRPISRHAQCPKCFEALRCCRLCRYFNEGVTAHCEDERADPPTRKESANFCEYFRPKSGAYVASKGQAARQARDRLEALFGAGGAQPGDAFPDTGPEPVPLTREEQARAALEALFDKPPNK